MKKLIKHIKFIIIILCVIALTACTGVVKTPMDLIKKPIVPSGGEFPRNIITKSLPDSAVLIRPISQDLSSIDYINLLPNKQNNIYAFFKNEDNASVGAIILDKQGDEWQPISIIEETASDIVLAEFTDFNGDGVRDLIMGVTISDEYFNSLNFYLNTGGDFIRVYQDRYTDFIHEDLDGDGVLDVVTLTIDRNNTASAKLLTFLQNDVLIKDELIMDEYNSGYYNIKYGNIDGASTGIVLDKKIGANYATNIIKYDGENLLLTFDEYMSTESYEFTYKNAPVKSRDINDDKIIEIARSIAPKFYDEHIDEREQIPYLYGWYQIDDLNHLNLVKLTYNDENYKFSLNLPDKWLKVYEHGDFSVIKSSQDADNPFVTFYYTPNNNKVIRLYTLSILNQDKFESLKETITDAGGSYFTHYNKDGLYYLGRYYPEIDGLTPDDKAVFKALIPDNQELRAFFYKYN